MKITAIDFKSLLLVLPQVATTSHNKSNTKALIVRSTQKQKQMKAVSNVFEREQEEEVLPLPHIIQNKCTKGGTKVI